MFYELFAKFIRILWNSCKPHILVVVKPAGFAATFRVLFAWLKTCQKGMRFPCKQLALVVVQRLVCDTINPFPCFWNFHLGVLFNNFVRLSAFNVYPSFSVFHAWL